MAKVSELTMNKSRKAKAGLSSPLGPASQMGMDVRQPSVLIVAGGSLQAPIVREVQSRGLRALVTDRDPDCPCAELADAFFCLDTYDVEGHRQLAHDLVAEGINLRGIFTAAADVEVTVAEAARAVGLPGLDPTVARAIHDKVAMRHGLRHLCRYPRWHPIRPDRDLEAEVSRLLYSPKAGKVPFPLVVKAADNCGSRGLSAVEHPVKSRLLHALRRAREASRSGDVLIEEQLRGPEQSVEIIFDLAGKAHPLNIVSRLFSRVGIERGHVNPPGLSQERQKSLFDLTRAAARALSVDRGVFKCDTIWDQRRGPCVLETTARLSGGWDSTHTAPLARGVDLIGAALDLALGEDLDLEKIETRRSGYAAAISAVWPVGVLKDVEGIEEVARMAGVEEVILRLKPGDRVRPLEDCAARPAFVIARGESYDQALERAKAGANALRPRYRRALDES